MLIGGEDGTGRKVAAREIHVGRSGSDAAFIIVNCAAHDAEELDAALFGAAAHAQHYGDPDSGGLARISREGRLYAAIGGTIYLQHVAEAATKVQARLARVLRDREALLSETGEPIAIDIRPMAGVDSASTGRSRKAVFATICSGACR